MIDRRSGGSGGDDDANAVAAAPDNREMLFTKTFPKAWGRCWDEATGEPLR